MKNLNKIIAGLLITTLMASSSLTPVYAQTPQSNELKSNNVTLTTPEYDSEWGLNFPERIGEVTTYGKTNDVVAIDIVRTNKSFDSKNYQSYPLIIITSLFNVYYPNGISSHPQDFSKLMAEVMDKEVLDILDKDGNSVPINQILHMPQLDDHYYSVLKPNEVVFTILFKNSGRIAQNFQLKSNLYWEKVKSSVIQPALTGKLSHSFSSGVSETQAYNFAKTVGHSQSISIGGQLKAGSSNSGTLTSNFTYTISNSITQSFSRSTTISSQESTSVDYTFNNTENHPVGVAIYRPVEVFSLVRSATSPQNTLAYDTFVKNILGEGFSSELKGYARVSLPPVYAYNHSDFISLSSK